MQTRKAFLKQAGCYTAGTILLPSFLKAGNKKINNIGVQLYTFRNELLKDAKGTLKKIAALGIKQIESARSVKGNFYGLQATEMKQICDDLGMTLRSGHIHVDEHWHQTIDELAASGQEYVICSSMPSQEQTVENYKKAAEVFNTCGEDCKKRNLKFGYHNHDAEFETESGEVLYDVLLKNTDPNLVHMELDLGWVIMAGKDPLEYFKNYEGRFPLWHLKDMDLKAKHSTEFGKGSLDIITMLKHKKQAGMKYFFIEQEEYTSSAFESIKENVEYLSKLAI